MELVENTRVRYFAVSVDLLNAEDLNLTESIILSRLYGLYAHGEGVLYCSDQWISDETGINKKTVSRALKSLEAKTYITRRTKMGKGNGKTREILIEQKFYDVTKFRDKESYHPEYEGERSERLERQTENKKTDWYSEIMNT